MMVALQAAAAQLFRVGDCAGLGDGPVRPDGGVRGARQVRQLRPRRLATHALLPGVSKRTYKNYGIVNCNGDEGLKKRGPACLPALLG